MNRAIAPLVVAALVLTTPFATAADATPAPADLLLDLARAGGLSPVGVELPAAASLRAEILAHYDLLGAAPTPAGLARLDAALAEVPMEIQAPVARLVAAMNEAARMRHAAFARVSVEDARFAHAATLSDAPLSAQDEARLADLLVRIDRDRMASAAALVLEATRLARGELALAAASGQADGVAFVDPLGSIEIAGTGADLHAADRTLLVDLGGDDVWTNNAGASVPEFVIEAFPGCVTTGGLDCTPLSKGRNDHALESLMGRPCSVEGIKPGFLLLEHLPAVEAEVKRQLGSLNAFALARFLQQSTLPALLQAAAATDADTRCLQPQDDPEGWADDFVTRGILGDGDEHVVAVALDLSGDDRFAPPRVFNDINDGDNVAGCDTRHLGEAGRTWERNLTAGGAFAGVGILWDAGGSDFYGGRSITQGVGHVGGVGVLVDEGRGRDAYEGVRLAQGAAIFAALGLLYDDGGDDVYGLRNQAPFFNEFEHFFGCDVSTRDGQGRANFNAVGALVDLGGDDTYHVDTHDPSVPGASRDDPTTTQGSTGTRLNVGPSPVNGAAALGFGLLWDRGGSDGYTREGRADGGFDAGGAFWDEA